MTSGSHNPPRGKRLHRRTAVTVGLTLSVCAAAQVPTTPALPNRPTPQTPSIPSAAPAMTSGTVNGSVTDAAGTPIAGAHITLAMGGHAAAAEATSDDAGRFRFATVSPGSFEIEVTLPGFDTRSASGTLKPGQDYQVPPLALTVATVKFAVEAVVPVEELQLEQLHAEEQQRLLDLFPNFFVSYRWTAPPLTTGQKFRLATKNASDPGNLLLVGTVSAVQQAENAFPGYSQGWKGYGRRYGANLGNLVAGTYMGGAVLPSLFHQDPRYFYRGTGSVRSRFFYAVSTAVICRGDNGHRQPAFAGVLGDLSAGAISNLYYAPRDRQGAALTFENGLLAIAGDAMNGVVQEFFLRRFTHGAKPPAP